MDSAYPQVFCVKFLSKSVNISKSYASKRKGVFLSEQSEVVLLHTVSFIHSFIHSIHSFHPSIYPFLRLLSQRQHTTVTKYCN